MNGWNRLTLVAKESFGLLALCGHEASYEEIDNGCKKDHEENDLGLMDGKSRRWHKNREVMLSFCDHVKQGPQQCCV